MPADATPGDHIGVITATLVSSVISKSGQRLHLLQTVGTRIFLRVSGPLHPSLKVTGLAVDYQGTLDPIGTGKAQGHLHRFQHRQHRPRRAPDGQRIGTVRGPVQGRPPPEDPAFVAGLLGQGDGRDKRAYSRRFARPLDVSVRPLYIDGSVAPRRLARSRPRSRSGPYRGHCSQSSWWLILLVVGWFLQAWRRGRRRPAPPRVQEPEGETESVSRNPHPDDAPASNGSSERKAAGHESPANGPTPVVSD